MIIVLSPHTDDAIFSIGAHLAGLDDVVIASVFAGIPDDPAGRAKHTTLRAEHAKACELIGATALNSDFLDDVYPPTPLPELREFIASATAAADMVYMPIGIRHPDHVTVATVALELSDTMNRVRIYEELPYRTDYPDDAARGIANLKGCLQAVAPCGDDDQKLAAVRCYASQIDASVITRVMQPENVWELVR